ncbi:hypothetical protein H8Z78_01040 [Dysosmobacter sp. NSJ-60]|uniref:Phage tail protein n=2 Tax=root TaxID=1 RepID=A0A810QCC6_9FIRM|nr:hypothetical protein [Pusillibacter faecalis]MBC5746450.1 hypothetical protein [Dysosmobacter hominis]MBS5658056.1 hypothetical protein [Oscillibacter sp.]BCK83822.1 hypothetical protein MM59RIKEN_11410 [Pusillibacter faecalis]DAE06413.1 MAG TPA: 43 kDa tail protein [Myoviridae sp. ctPGO22]
MTGRIFTSTHQTYDLPPLLSWSVVHTGTVPCDSYTVTCLYSKEMAPILPLAAGFIGFEDGQLVARGIVDDFSVDLDGGGTTVTITGRGAAARLLDNESRPVTYQDATLEEIVRRHVTPYGVVAREVADVQARSVYTVAAGTSQWKVLESFCRTYGGFAPRFAINGALLAAPERDNGRRLCIGDADPVLHCSWREDHYGVLTEALVIDKKRNVSYSVKNPDMIAKGGQCRRVVYTPGQSTWAAMRYTGEYQIQKSREEQRLITVTMPGSFLAYPGDRVELSLSRLGLSGTFRVAEAENVCSQRDGFTATLTLKEGI